MDNTNTIVKFDMSKPVFWYLEAVLCFEIIVFSLEFYLNIKQYKKFLEKEVPKEITNIVNQEDFDKCQSHSKDQMEFEMFHKYTNKIEDLIVTIFRFQAWMWNLAGIYLARMGFDENDDIKRAILFLIMSSVMEVLRGTPWTMYKTFVISQRHGFNNQTLRLFFIDLAKSKAVETAITVPLVYILFKIIEWGGEHFYFYAFAFILVFMLAMIYIYPNFIMPWFNKFTELNEEEHGDLLKRVKQLALDIKFPLKKIFVIDASTRSSHSNAYFFGFGNNKRIVLFDTLLKQCSTDEIISILAHELGHWKKNHTTYQMIFSFSNIFLIFYLFSFVINEESIFISFGYDQKSNFIGLFLFFMIFQPIQFATKFLKTYATRQMEFQADEFSRGLGYGQELQQGLIKIHTKNASNLNPDPYYASYHFSHPQLSERLKAIATNELAQAIKAGATTEYKEKQIPKPNQMVVEDEVKVVKQNLELSEPIQNEKDLTASVAPAIPASKEKKSPKKKAKKPKESKDGFYEMEKFFSLSKYSKQNTQADKKKRL